jgi:hypothetical protein
MADAASPASPLEAANDWYLALRERELAAQGKPVSGMVLRDLMRLEVADGSAAVAGVPMTLGVCSRLSEVSVRLNGQDGRLISWYVDALAEDSAQGLPEDILLKLATETALPPPDAVLAEHGYETMADRTFFRARWVHMSEGLPVEDDYIEVLVNGALGKAFSFSRLWREPRVGQGPKER